MALVKDTKDTSLDTMADVQFPSELLVSLVRVLERVEETGKIEQAF